MWEIPKLAVVTTGVGTSASSLGSFDDALKHAGISDLNLVKISSILPPRTKVITYTDYWGNKLGNCKGAIIPAVYSFITSNIPGTLISSAVAIGVPREDNKPGVIFEAASKEHSGSEAETIASDMVSEAMSRRGITDFYIIKASSEVKVISAFCCALSAVVLLNDEI